MVHADSAVDNTPNRDPMFRIRSTTLPVLSMTFEALANLGEGAIKREKTHDCHWPRSSYLTTQTRPPQILRRCHPATLGRSVTGSGRRGVRGPRGPCKIGSRCNVGILGTRQDLERVA